MSQRGGWLRDLTQEGIEPNPGPTSPRVLSNVSTHEDMLLDSGGPSSDETLVDFQNAA